MNIDDIVNLKIDCFKCKYGHNCKYYSNILWFDWMINHKDDGCPALKYSFNSIYIAWQKKLEEEKKARISGIRTSAV